MIKTDPLVRTKRNVRIMVAAAAAVASSAIFAFPSVYPTGTTIYDPAKAHNQYVIFPGADNKTHLIDMNGNEVHRWDYPGQPSGMIDPALIGGKRGHIIAQTYKGQAGPANAADCETAYLCNNTGMQAGAPAGGMGAGAAPGGAPGGMGAGAPGGMGAGGAPGGAPGGMGADAPAGMGQMGGQANKTLGEVDWNGNIVWTFGEKAPGGASRQHHDWERMANGNTLVLSDIRKPIPGFTNPTPTSDMIYEVSPSGDIVWTWDMSEHLDELGFTPSEMALIKATDKAGYFHVNSARQLGPNQWYKAGDKKFAPDNIIISARNANFVAIIDKASSKIVWQIGPHYETWEARGPVPHEIDQIVGQHDAHVIPEGLPGAGNILIFDNQGEGGYPPAEMKMNGGSRVIEVNPATRKIVWKYIASNSGSPDWTFFSAFISNARRLPNGNTFIVEGSNGRFFQVTPQGEIVWEYVSPYFAPGPGGTANWTYRAQPVPYDWVPEGTPRTQAPVIPSALADFRISK